MIPESCENGSAELWRATQFPFHWKLEKTLWRGSAVDTTPIFHLDRWYFFTTLDEPAGNAAFAPCFLPIASPGTECAIRAARSPPMFAMRGRRARY